MENVQEQLIDHMKIAKENKSLAKEEVIENNCKKMDLSRVLLKDIQTLESKFVDGDTIEICGYGYKGQVLVVSCNENSNNTLYKANVFVKDILDKKLKQQDSTLDLDGYIRKFKILQGGKIYSRNKRKEVSYVELNQLWINKYP